MGCPQDAVLVAVEEMAGRGQDPPCTEFFCGGLHEVDVAEFRPDARQVLERAVSSRLQLQQSTAVQATFHAR
jgi:hypothetical protein